MVDSTDLGIVFAYILLFYLKKLPFLVAEFISESEIRPLKQALLGYIDDDTIAVAPASHASTTVNDGYIGW